MSTPPSSSPPGWWRSSPSPSSSSPPSPSGWCGCTGSCWCPWGPALPPTTCSILRIVHWPMNKIERCHLWPIILSYKTCYLYYICISFSFCNTEYKGKFKMRFSWNVDIFGWHSKMSFLSVHLEDEISDKISLDDIISKIFTTSFYHQKLFRCDHSADDSIPNLQSLKTVAPEIHISEFRTSPLPHKWISNIAIATAIKSDLRQGKQLRKTPTQPHVLAWIIICSINYHKPIVTVGTTIMHSKQTLVCNLTWNKKYFRILRAPIYTNSIKLLYSASYPI